MRVILMLSVAMVCCSAGVVVAKPQTLADYKGIYERELKKILGDQDGYREIGDEYLKDLLKLEGRFKKDGNFRGTKAVMDERNRYLSSNELPDETAADSPLELVEARKDLLEAAAKLEQGKSDRVAVLTRRYVAALKAYNRTLLEQGQMDRAEEVDLEIQNGESFLKARDEQDRKGKAAESGLACRTHAKSDKLVDRFVGAGKMWNFKKGYSLKQNPSKEWSYGWTPSLGGEFVKYTEAYDENSWAGWRWNKFVPSVAVNHADQVREGTRPGDVQLHPGPSGQYSVVRWTAPQSAKMKVEGSFEAGNIGLVDVHVLHNGSELLAVQNTHKNEPFSKSISVKCGDIVDFCVGAGRNGFGSCATPLDITISQQ